ncbi:MAG: hypothetical protein H6R17_2922 [Proteobacteria bacterium]|nr:hypothetical protein [Pseudomonadota bacterium]
MNGKSTIAPTANAFLIAMNAKPKPPTRPAAAPKPRQPAANPLRQAASRWQRTVRYGWDKGGARGGRK